MVGWCLLSHGIKPACVENELLDFSLDGSALVPGGYRIEYSIRQNSALKNGTSAPWGPPTMTPG